MTDAHVPEDRRPEFGDGRAPQRVLDPRPRAARVSLPLNPWLTFLLVTWISLLLLAVILLFAWSGFSTLNWDGNGADPREVAKTMAALAGWSFAIGAGALLVWVGVRALQWKALEA